MPAHTPEEVHRLWAEAFSAHDLEAVMALYEPEATLIPPGQEVPNLIVTGAEAVREHLSGLLALKPKFELEFKKAFQAGDIALLFSDWTLSGTDPEGNAIELAGRTSDVARRQPNGSWLVVIDDPYGSAHGFG
ncbi:MAG TPA: nuclear transport factor 2 family protein [Rhodothermales bacterium]|nr:nuclear transport factor 2 family protein [Rhodothermales bacterium]